MVARPPSPTTSSRRGEGGEESWAFMVARPPSPTTSSRRGEGGEESWAFMVARPPLQHGVPTINTPT
jgi:hypothetical protein